MRKILIGTAAVAAILLTGCSKVTAGHVGVKVHLLGASSGVDSEELGPGRYWIGINEELYLFPTFTQNYTWTSKPIAGDFGLELGDESLDFQTIEGLKVNADVGISYHINPAKVTDVFQKYRKGVDEITDVYLRNMVRDALVEVASDLPIESVYGAGKTALMDEVQQLVMEQVSPIGIEVEKVYWIGELRLPQTVVNSINAKIEATQIAQQRQNEIVTAQAEAQKQVEQAKGQAEAQLTRARAEAEALQLRGDALRRNPEIIQLNAVEKWNGTLPTFMGGEQAVPFIQVQKP